MDENQSTNIPHNANTLSVSQTPRYQYQTRPATRAVRTPRSNTPTISDALGAALSFYSSDENNRSDTKKPSAATLPEENTTFMNNTNTQYRPTVPVRRTFPQEKTSEGANDTELQRSLDELEGKPQTFSSVAPPSRPAVSPRHVPDSYRQSPRVSVARTPTLMEALGRALGSPRTEEPKRQDEASSSSSPALLPTSETPQIPLGDRGRKEKGINENKDSLIHTASEQQATLPTSNQTQSVPPVTPIVTPPRSSPRTLSGTQSAVRSRTPTLAEALGRALDPSRPALEREVVTPYRRSTSTPEAKPEVRPPPIPLTPRRATPTIGEALSQAVSSYRRVSDPAEKATKETVYYPLIADETPPVTPRVIKLSTVPLLSPESSPTKSIPPEEAGWNKSTPRPTRKDIDLQDTSYNPSNDSSPDKVLEAEGKVVPRAKCELFKQVPVEGKTETTVKKPTPDPVTEVTAKKPAMEATAKKLAPQVVARKAPEPEPEVTAKEPASEPAQEVVARKVPEPAPSSVEKKSAPERIPEVTAKKPAMEATAKKLAPQVVARKAPEPEPEVTAKEPASEPAQEVVARKVPEPARSSVEKKSAPERIPGKSRPRKPAMEATAKKLAPQVVARKAPEPEPEVTAKEPASEPAQEVVARKVPEPARSSVEKKSAPKRIPEVTAKKAAQEVATKKLAPEVVARKVPEPALLSMEKRPTPEVAKMPAPEPVPEVTAKKPAPSSSVEKKPTPEVVAPMVQPKTAPDHNPLASSARERSRGAARRREGPRTDWRTMKCGPRQTRQSPSRRGVFGSRPHPTDRGHWHIAGVGAWDRRPRQRSEENQLKL